MTRRLAYAVIVLFVLAAAPGWTGMFWTIHNEHVTQAAAARQDAIQRRQAAREAAAQRREGQIIEAKLCADLGTMAAIRPPAGPAASNPSRAYEQDEHRAWAGLDIGIGCRH